MGQNSFICQLLHIFLLIYLYLSHLVIIMIMLGTSLPSLLLVLLYSNSAAGQGCCKMKVVGGATYTLLGEEDTSTFSCLDKCTYKKEGEADSKYCFAEGDLQTECKDTAGSPPATAGAPAAPTTASAGGAATPASVGGAATPSSAAGGGGNDRSYLAGISYSFDTSNSPFCAGSLISSQWILTTASCSYSDRTKTPVDKVNVVLGEEMLGSPDQEKYKVVGVTKIIVHPSYSNSEENNIALWQLSEPVSSSVYNTLCLPTQGAEQSGAVVLVGWRISPVVGSLSETLTQVDTTVVSDTQCGVSDTLLCTAPDTTGCQGDLGGPLVQGGDVLVGAVAFDKGCNRGGYGIFTQISKFSSWVATQIANNGGGEVCLR